VRRTARSHAGPPAALLPNRRGRIDPLAAARSKVHWRMLHDGARHRRRSLRVSAEPVRGGRGYPRHARAGSRRNVVIRRTRGRPADDRCSRAGCRQPRDRRRRRESRTRRCDQTASELRCLDRIAATESRTHRVALTFALEVPGARPARPCVYFDALRPPPLTSRQPSFRSDAGCRRHAALRDPTRGGRYVPPLPGRSAACSASRSSSRVS
jgi:hypothetical protein